jgi:hypothetical protein
MTVPKIWESGERWVVHRVLCNSDQGYEGVTPFLKTKQLLPRDIAVWVAVVERVNWRTGHCPMTLSALAQEIGLDSKYVINSVSRLKGLKLLKNEYNPKTNERWILVNPYVVWCGDPKLRAIRKEEWRLAWTTESQKDAEQRNEEEQAQRAVDLHNKRVDLAQRFNRAYDAQQERLANL